MLGAAAVSVRPGMSPVGRDHLERQHRQQPGRGEDRDLGGGQRKAADGPRGDAGDRGARAGRLAHAQPRRPAETVERHGQQQRMLEIQPCHRADGKDCPPQRGDMQDQPHQPDPVGGIGPDRPRPRRPGRGGQLVQQPAAGQEQQRHGDGGRADLRITQPRHRQQQGVDPEAEGRPQRHQRKPPQRRHGHPAQLDFADAGIAAGGVAVQRPHRHFQQDRQPAEVDEQTEDVPARGQRQIASPRRLPGQIAPRLRDRRRLGRDDAQDAQQRQQRGEEHHAPRPVLDHPRGRPLRDGQRQQRRRQDHRHP